MKAGMRPERSKDLRQDGFLPRFVVRAAGGGAW